MNNNELTLPVLKSGERFQIDAGRLKWRGKDGWAAKAGITSETPIEKVKEAQKALKEAQKAEFRLAKSFGAAMIADDRFKQVKFTYSTDKAGNNVFAVRGTTKALKLPKSLEEKGKMADELSVEELKAVLAAKELEVKGEVVING